jgi:hypothetical protein
MEMSMDQEPRGRLFQDDAFVFAEFDGLRLERLVVLENVKTGACVLVYILVEGHGWHQFFLQAGIGFWEVWDDVEMEDEPNYHFKDVTDALGLAGQRILRIHCEPDQVNSRIVIAFEQGNALVLKVIDPAVWDDNCELLLVEAEDFK